MRNKYELTVIGAGAVGCAIAYEAARNGISVCVIERNPDVCFETSSRNSGIVHAGFNNVPGSIKAKYCKLGSRSFEKLAKEIDVPYRVTGKYVVALTKDDESVIDDLIKQGEENGVSVEKTTINGKKALYSPNTAITDPIRYTIALAEAAHLNGADFKFDLRVRSIEKNEDGNFEITTNKTARFAETEEIYTSSYVVNAAGMGSVDICKLVGITDYEILPCRGEYHVLDKYMSTVDYPIYPAVKPGADVLGVHLSPTIEGNILIGPSSEYLDSIKDKVPSELYATTSEYMDMLLTEGKMLLPQLDGSRVIRSFSGVRPKIKKNGDLYNDYVIDDTVPNMINLLGIESPGITASMPLAKHVVYKIMSSWDDLGSRKVAMGSFPYNRLSGAQQQICRCENITANDITMAYDRLTSIGARPTLKGLKNRTRIGMGRCQGSFCTGEMINILRKERQIDPLKFEMAGIGSKMFTGRLR